MRLCHRTLPHSTRTRFESTRLRMNFRCSGNVMFMKGWLLRIRQHLIYNELITFANKQIHISYSMRRSRGWGGGGVISPILLEMKKIVIFHICALDPPWKNFLDPRLYSLLL